ncbi:transcription factor HES-1-like [Gigantopelta aegis]|uniref:transcription factor HES-1-like n=1 Tax=Gigantopelta aegis TaxID=1735272 RepID=UPI001B88838D|nr:transcription factor HES-1-like [Gigantopelta aegis]
MNKYRAGFNECAGEVARYMDSSTGVDLSVKNRVLNHLANCVNHVTPNTQSAQVHPALIQPLHVQMPPTNQLGVSAFSITCAPTWNVIGSNNITNITMSGNAQQNIRPSPSPAFSTKMEYSTVNRIPDAEARPPRLQCIVSPLDTTCDVKGDSSGSDDVENCSSLDLSVKNHCDRQSPKDISEPVVDVPVKQEHRPECIPELRVPTPQVQGPAHAYNDTMWRPW